MPKTTSFVEGFKTNNTAVLKQVYHNTYPKVRRYILDNSGNVAYAKDIFQEAFITCWRNVKNDAVQPNTNIEAYLYTIAKHKWLDVLRSKAFKLKTVDLNANITSIEETFNVTEDKETEQKLEIMNQAFKRLGTPCQELLKQFYFEKKSMKAIAAVLHITPASARNQKYRCMEKLKALSHKYLGYD